MATVSVRQVEGLRLEGASESGTLAIDLGQSRGGTGAGFEPGELLLFALGGCMVHNMRIFADRNRILLGAVEAELTAESSDSAPKRISKILIRLRLDGNLTPEDEARLLRVANRCKIHNTLEHPPTFEVAVERGALRGR